MEDSVVEDDMEKVLEIVYRGKAVTLDQASAQCRLGKVINQSERSCDLKHQ